MVAVGAPVPGLNGRLDDLIGHSIVYRLAMGPGTGQQLFTLQTLPARCTQHQW